MVGYFSGGATRGCTVLHSRQGSALIRRSYGLHSCALSRHYTSS